MMRPIIFWGIYEYSHDGWRDTKRLVILRDTKEYCQEILDVIKKTHSNFATYVIEGITEIK